MGKTRPKSPQGYVMIKNFATSLSVSRDNIHPEFIIKDYHHIKEPAMYQLTSYVYCRV